MNADPTSPDDRPCAGQSFSGWTLVERVSEGNFADVWRALREPSFGAVKIAISEVGRRMLDEEVAVAERLASMRGRVVPILAHGHEPLRHLVMPWLPVTLRTVVAGIRTEDDRASALSLFLRLAGSVAKLHELSVVHGDLKPENVLIADASLACRGPLLTDFGLARELRAWRLDQSLSHSLGSAERGVRGGTIAYLAPEALQGTEPSSRTDVYALGVILHEILLGRRPDVAQDAESLRPFVPGWAAEILPQALAYEAAARYPTARAFHDDLEIHAPSMTATGFERAARAAGRTIVAGTAAFFISLRYVFVVALLLLYAVLIGASVIVHPAFLLGLAVMAGLHVFIRWEGPETREEALQRSKGLVVSDAGPARQAPGV